MEVQDVNTNKCRTVLETWWQNTSYPKDKVNQTAASFIVLSFTGWLKHFTKVNQI